MAAVAGDSSAARVGGHTHSIAARQQSGDRRAAAAVAAAAVGSTSNGSWRLISAGRSIVVVAAAVVVESVCASPHEGRRGDGAATMMREDARARVTRNAANGKRGGSDGEDAPACATATTANQLVLTRRITRLFVVTRLSSEDARASARRR